MSKDPIIKVSYLHPKYTSTTEFAQVVTKYGQRKTMEKLANELRKSLDYYIPKRTGTMQKEGYEIKTGVRKAENGGAWFKLEYRNTSTVPYVMYQYWGKIWERNYTMFSPDMTLTKASANPMASYKTGNKHFAGFRSKEGEKKVRTERTLGLRKSFSKNGVWIKTGYTGRNKHAEWVDYFCNKTTKYFQWRESTAEKILAEVLAEYRRKKGL